MSTNIAYGKFKTLVLLCVLLALAAAARAQAAPQIDLLSEVSLSRSGRLLIFGAGFGSAQGDGEVVIDGIGAIVTTWRDTEIHAYVPETATAGPVTVEVLTAAGSSTALLDVTLRSTDGRVRWRFQMDSPFPGVFTAVGPDGTVYATDNWRLYALDATGGLKWILPGAGGGRPITFGGDGTIYTGAGPVHAVDPVTGTFDWTFTPPQGVPSLVAGPGIGPDGMIYGVQNVLNDGIGLFSLNAVDGTLDQSDIGNPAITSFPGSNAAILFDGNNLYFGVVTDGSAPPQIWAYELGVKDLWFRSTGCESIPRLDPSGRLIVAGQGGCGVTALNPNDGREEWNAQPPQNVGQLVQPAVGPDGAIYTADFFGGDFWAINPDGSTKWFLVDGHGFMAHLGVSPNNAVIVDGGQAGFGVPGWLRGYDTGDGSLLWQVDLPTEDGLNLFTWSDQPTFTGDGQTAYVTTRFAGSGEYSYIYAVDVSGGQGGEPPAPTNQSPTASFTAAPTTGVAPLPVAFDASASSDPDGSIATYAWTFGDGAIGAGVTASYTYTTAGTYTVTLTVTDDGGLSGSTSTTVSVSGDAGVADVVSIDRAECDSRKLALRLQASSDDPAAELTTVLDGVTHSVTNGRQTRISLAASCPATITVESTGGGQAEATVKIK